MKNKLVPFLIGLLIGAIVTAAGFLIYMKVNANNMPGGNREEMRERFENGERPEMPEDGNMVRPEGKGNRDNNVINENTTENENTI